MIVSTTPSLEGYRIQEYKGVVFGEVIAGINLFKDFGAGLTNLFGGRSDGYEEELLNARSTAMAEMEGRVDMDYEMLGSDNGMMMVNVSGTAVVVEKI